MRHDYGVWHIRQDELWRGPFRLRATAENWIKEWEEDGGRPGTFKVVQREPGEWHDIQA